MLVRKLPFGPSQARFPKQMFWTGLFVLWLSSVGWAGPQHEAAVRGDLEALRAFRVQQLNATDARGLTALTLAIREGHPECVPLLLQLGANPNLGSWSPLHEAALQGDVESARLLLAAKADPNRREGANSGTPLHVAAFGGRTEICRLLLRAGAKVNLRDGERLTPLFHARDQAHNDTYELLKASGGQR
jgi:ankyrin repeat protein